MFTINMHGVRALVLVVVHDNSIGDATFNIVIANMWCIFIGHHQPQRVAGRTNLPSSGTIMPT